MDDVTRNPDEPQRSQTSTLPTAPVPPPPAGRPDATSHAPTAAGAPTTGASTGWSTPQGSTPLGATAYGSAPAGASTAEQPSTSVFGTQPPPHDPYTGQPPAEPKRRRAPMLLAGVALGAVLGGAAGAGVATYLNDDDETAAPVTRSDLGSGNTGGEGSASQTSDGTGVQAVADQVLPSVVSIAVQSQFGQSGGTGIVISSDGEILTNNHVVEGAGQNGTVQVTFADGTTADAEVVGTDPLTDLAVIRAQDVSDLTPATLGSSGELAVGEQVVAIGSPLGLDGTVTSGIVSALQRPVAAGGEQQGGGVNSVFDAVQTDAPINPGNSGGPLVNMDGEVVGINSAIIAGNGGSGSIGLGFAIPIDQAKPIIEELRSGQEATHAQIGVGVGTPQDGTRGALIASVNSGSAGAEAGLQEGDIVTRVNDRIVTDATSLIAAVRSYRPGDEITLTYLRDGQEQTAQVTLGSDAQGT
ncbi:S1C family serine protease [Jiangella gansuensis]|uniref:S1C family serine protease n=1 Tax=Jiangella gansuensis TaxID=281473 RepID=UPI0004B66752|nr:trypsin-like peptidase domain-containing protein [Jiangella gansuensis]